MPSVELSYSLITPARDEAPNLRRLFSSLVAQTVPPRQWVIVDNGSTDETPDVVADLEGPWIRLTSVPGEDRPEPGAPVVRAFHAGLAELDEAPDLVVKLDADVSFEPTYFERLLEAFEEEPRLGIASGACLEEVGGAWRPVHVTGGHVRGAARAYRWPCLQDVLPLEERMGWDGIDELKAAVLGWRTGTVPGLTFHHHRALGARDGRLHTRWVRQGEASYYMGYRPSYLLFRTLHHSLRDPAAIAMIGAYVRAALTRAPRYPDDTVRRYLRREQSLRSLPKRLREARGLDSR
jgi:biofilm PGA synthesis N-glycosyltransferase PgaC